MTPLKTGNYFLSIGQFQLNTPVFQPPAFQNCSFQEIPAIQKIKMRKDCYSESEQIKRIFVFFRRGQNLSILTLAYSMKGEESAEMILDSLIFLD